VYHYAEYETGYSLQANENKKMFVDTGMIVDL